MSNYILTTNGELYHYGVKGMKWGVRKEKKYADRVGYIKRIHSSERYENEARYSEAEIARMKKLGYRRYAKLNDLDAYTDTDQRQMYANDLKLHSRNADSARFWMKESANLSKKLDSIDTSSMTYRQAIKRVKQCENEWLNETIDKESKKPWW